MKLKLIILFILVVYSVRTYTENIPSFEFYNKASFPLTVFIAGNHNHFIENPKTYFHTYQNSQHVLKVQPNQHYRISKIDFGNKIRVVIWKNEIDTMTFNKTKYKFLQQKINKLLDMPYYAELLGIYDISINSDQTLFLTFGPAQGIFAQGWSLYPQSGAIIGMTNKTRSGLSKEKNIQANQISSNLLFTLKQEGSKRALEENK